MINQEFIAMCDCKEIQSDWKPKLGDWYFYSSFALAKTIFENEDSKKIEERITLIDCEKSIPTLGRFMSIYIPSIEDLIEMCKNKIYSKSSMISNTIRFSRSAELSSACIVPHFFFSWALA